MPLWSVFTAQKINKHFEKAEGWEIRLVKDKLFVLESTPQIRDPNKGGDLIGNPIIHVP